MKVRSLKRRFYARTGFIHGPWLARPLLARRYFDCRGLWRELGNNGVILAWRPHV